MRARLLVGLGASVLVVTLATSWPHHGGRLTAAGAAPSRPASATAPPTPPNPTATPTAEGARAAALAYLAAGPALAAGDVDQAVATQRAMATAAAGDQLAAGLRSQRAALAEAFGPRPLRWWVAPLATRVTTNGPEEAEVAIWYVSVLAAGDQAPFEQWRLVRLQLAWEDGAWKVAGEHDGAGPRPGVLPRPEPSTAAELAAATEGFEPAAAQS